MIYPEWHRKWCFIWITRSREKDFVSSLLFRTLISRHELSERLLSCSVKCEDGLSTQRHDEYRIKKKMKPGWKRTRVTHPQLVSSRLSPTCRDAMPKSAILMLFFSSNNKFSGFKSLWLQDDRTGNRRERPTWWSEVRTEETTTS